jgi:hypothetical protein
MKRQGIAIALGVGVLLALVAAASRTQLFHESEPPLSPGLARLLADFSIYLLLALELLVGAAVVWALWPGDGYAAPELKRRPWWHLLAQYALLALFLGAGLLLVNRYRSLLERPPPLAGGAAGLPPAPLPGTPAGAPPGFDWLAFGLVVVLIVAAALALWRQQRRRWGARRAERELQRALADVVADALDDLREDTDSRRAVIQAYARMERVLAVHAVPRRPSETPAELLARALMELDIREPAIRRLTELFEFAKFSPHPVDEAMRADALESLAAIREDLLAPAPPSPALGAPVAG